MNQRNNIYVKQFNPDKGIRLANNKEQTKKFLSQRSIPVPKTFFHIKNRHDWLYFDFWKLPSKVTSFVIKPNNGSKGQGIFVVNDMRTREWILENTPIHEKSIVKRVFQSDIQDFWYEFLIGKKRVSEWELKKKAVWIFQWLYSSSWKADTLLIEDRLVPWSGFEIFCAHGLADMRIIMFNLVPVIAMLRVPTEQSGGKANLAQGWVGLGVDIVTGKINSLYLQSQSYTTTFPPERSHFKNKKIPYRQEILDYSANAQYFVNSGYLGMDWVVTNKWPKLLEINARAWLEIQNITGKPLLNIMKKIEDLHVTTPSKGLEISRTLFGGDKTTEIKPNNTIYLSQAGKLIYNRDNKKRGLPVSVSIGLDKVRNYTSEKIIKKLWWSKDIFIDLWSNNIVTSLSFQVDPNLQGNKIILWQKALENYYIIPSHKSKVSTKIINKEYIDIDELVSLTLLDEKINNLNKKLNLNKILKPKNYLDEFDKYVAHNGLYNPQFIYNFPSYKSLRIIEEELKQLDVKYRQKEYFDSQFAHLFFEKIDELQYKVNLLKSYKQQNLKNIEYYNTLLFGGIKKEFINLSEKKVINWAPKQYQHISSIISSWEVFERFAAYISKKKINSVRLKIDDSILSWISVGLGKHATIKIKSNINMREHKLVWKIAHEIDVHVMRYLYGKKTWWNILWTGTAWYITTEEWLAVYIAQQKTQDIIPWYDGIAKYESYDRLYKSTFFNFSEMTTYILKTPWGALKSYKTIFNAILKTKKWLKDTSLNNTGIVFGKNLVYLNGYMKVKDLAPEQITTLLSIGKISIENLKYFN